MLEYNFFYFTAWSVVILKCGEKLFLEKHKKFLRSTFFYFLGFASSLLKYRKFLFRKKYEFLKLWARKFHFQKYKKNLFWENIGNFFKRFFFNFLNLGWKVCQVALYRLLSISEKYQVIQHLPFCMQIVNGIRVVTLKS